jgi:dienelactone hydrolase
MNIIIPSEDHTRGPEADRQFETLPAEQSGLTAAAHYTHLGAFSDWVAAAAQNDRPHPTAQPGAATQQRIREVLGMAGWPEHPREVTVGRRWERDGVEGEEVSWSVGYGPRTAAWVLKPAGASGVLPGLLALHDHGGFKYYGKEKIAAGPDDPNPVMQAFHDMYYGGRPFANALARAGFVVVVHDTFLWGSRRFPPAAIPQSLHNIAAAYPASKGPRNVPDEIAAYNAAAELHEEVVEKYCALLGTTLAGVVSYEDRVALSYLASRPDVRAGALGCLGLSGGGCRSALLLATSDRIAAAHIAGMMTTYGEMLDHHVAAHTWMVFPSVWPRYGDWPDLAACRAPIPLLVQYSLNDALFTVRGMRAAHERLEGHYRSAGQPGTYRGEFYPGPHRFDLPMQEAAFSWLKQRLER